MVLKNVVLGIAIIILTVSVAVYGINTFYEEPEYSDFCDEFKTAQFVETQEQCDAVGGQWTSYDSGTPPRPKAVGEGEVNGFCDRDYYCRMDYGDAQEKYARNVFFVALPLGIIVIAIGAFVFGLEAVGAGLMGGGVGIILFGVGGYWRFSSDVIKFVLSLIGLIAVIWLSYFWNRKWSRRKKQFF